MSSSLYVGGLAPAVVEKDLVEVFSVPFDGDVECGLASTKINRDVYTRLSRCSAFLNFETPEAAARTLVERQHTVILGKPVVLRAYNERKAKPAQDENAPVECEIDAVIEPSVPAVAAEDNTFVTPLVPGMTEMELEAIFNQNFPGQIVSAHIPPGKNHGYVLFQDEAHASAAINTGCVIFSINVDGQDPVPHTTQIYRYRSYNERAKTAAELKKKNAAGPIVKKANCVTIRDAPASWTEVEIKSAVSIYGASAAIRFVPASRHSESHIVVEFVEQESVSRCIEGLNKRFCNTIDNFTLMNAQESERYSIIYANRDTSADTNPVVRLTVTNYKPEQSSGAKNANRNGKSPNNKRKNSPRRKSQSEAVVPENNTTEIPAPAAVAEVSEAH